MVNLQFRHKVASGQMYYGTFSIDGLMMNKFLQFLCYNVYNKLGIREDYYVIYSILDTKESVLLRNLS